MFRVYSSNYVQLEFLFDIFNNLASLCFEFFDNFIFRSNPFDFLLKFVELIS